MCQILFLTVFVGTHIDDVTVMNHNFEVWFWYLRTAHFNIEIKSLSDILILWPKLSFKKRLILAWNSHTAYVSLMIISLLTFSGTCHYSKLFPRNRFSYENFVIWAIFWMTKRQFIYRYSCSLFAGILYGQYSIFNFD